MSAYVRTVTTINQSTNVASTSTTQVEGVNLEVSGSNARYAQLGLKESQAVTLLFTPDKYGLQAWSEEFVKLGDTIVWPSGGATFTVMDVSPTAPDGIVIVAKIIVAR